MTYEQLELFEEWKQIPGYEGFYLASSFGRIMSLPRATASGGLLAQSNNGRDYRIVILTKKGKRRKFYVHRLIALAFLGEPLAEHEVDHIDGDRKNNTIKNLRYLRHTENVRVGKRTKLSPRDVLEIRRLSQEGFKQQDLADQFGVHQNHISRILRAQNWKETP